MKSVIQLVKTTQGYSIIQNGHQVNKTSTRQIRQKAQSLPKKFSQQNFTIYPYLFTSSELDSNHKYIIMPAKAQWFNLNQVHEIEKKALPQWFKVRKAVFGSIKPDKFQKNQQLYKKYRNHIIQLSKKSYVSPTQARKGLAGDVCAIIRIHNFLEGWGLINYVYPKKNLKNKPISNLNKDANQQLKLRKDCIDKDKVMCQKNYDKDHLQLLKKITKKKRPFCHLCQSICSVLWFQYSEKLFLKQFVSDGQKNQRIKIVSSDQPMFYHLIICATCVNNNNIPLFLQSSDLQKKTLNQDLVYQYEEPKDKKKINQQNKILQSVQKMKFNMKKGAEALKMEQKQFYEKVMFVPLIKIQKMARIDQETDAQHERENQQSEQKGSTCRQILSNGINGLHEEIKPQKSLSKKFRQALENLQVQEMEDYQKFIQSWLLKIFAKTGKLGEWEKSINYYSDQILSSQKNRLADMMKIL